MKISSIATVQFLGPMIASFPPNFSLLSTFKVAAGRTK